MRPCTKLEASLYNGITHIFKSLIEHQRNAAITWIMLGNLSGIGKLFEEGLWESSTTIWKEIMKAHLLA
jgi:hypothetical protein